jgi:dTDP-4-amino-4,6-dideoxygalactose transaminase
LNFAPNTLKSELKKNPNIKVVVIQNTLGYPCNIEEIAKICRERKIFLIEDLAHSVGTTYEGQEAGQVGDFTVLSFSQDKIIDGVSGGALVIRNKDYQQKELPSLEKITNKQQIIDHLYPIFTYAIRTTYRIGVGKLIHAVLKKSGLLSNPMGNQKVDELCALPDWYSSLAYECLQNLQSNLAHRKEIAFVYAKEINPEILMKSIVENIPMSTNLRFPIFVKNRSNIIKHLKSYGIYVSDIWYDAPIAPKKYMNMTDYENQCPESEKMSGQILNLPTHQNISKKQAKIIAERVNQWLKLH